MYRIFKIIFIVAFCFFSVAKIKAQHHHQKITGFYLVVEKSYLKIYDSVNKKILYLNPVKICSIDDFKEAKRVMDETKGASCVELDLNENGKEKFNKATQKNIGKSLAIIINNKLVVNGIIDSEIPEGRINISGNYTIAEATELAKAINNEIENNKSKF